jgi:hypothetical protein
LRKNGNGRFSRNLHWDRDLTDYETRAVKFESYKFSRVGAISQKKYESSLQLNKIKPTTAKDYALEGDISISHKSEAVHFRNRAPQELQLGEGKG